MSSKRHTARDAVRRALERPRMAARVRRNAAAFGSDVIAETLRALDIPYIALNPGRELSRPARLARQLSRQRAAADAALPARGGAVAIAHGYAKVTGRAMAAAVHSNVGLMHATMAIFNAWCDRMPVLVLGATGPVDAVKRRPWIDWIHTARDQGALVRGYTKWDDQPASPGAAREARCARLLDREHRAAGAGLRRSRRRDAGGAARRAAAAARRRAAHAAGGAGAAPDDDRSRRRPMLRAGPRGS